MKPYYQDNHNTIYCQDFRENELPAESVQMVVTSPPYWGLRKYSGEQDLIWGDNRCEHRWNIETSGLFTKEQAVSRRDNTGSNVRVKTGFCSLCGAWKGAYGLEPTPELYIQHTIEILREIRRVLRKDGVVFWNIGDSYAQSAGRTDAAIGRKAEFRQRGENKGYAKGSNFANYGGRIDEARSTVVSGLKPKDLCLIPQRLMIAAQEDGWWVRSVIIWSKPNPMPESVTDRPTESHEYIIMMTKSGATQYWTHRDGNRAAPNPDYRWVKEGAEVSEMPKGWTPKHKMDWSRINLWRGHDYYWDADAVREPNLPQSIERAKHAWKQHKTNDMVAIHNVDTERMGERFVPEAGRNIRTVWEFPTQPYPEAHFAVFPEKLPELCIKAATPEAGCCSKCGAPWERIVERTKVTEARPQAPGMTAKDVKGSPMYRGGHHNDGLGAEYQVDGIHWQPTCKCNADKVPSLVLDPFMGAGTTLWVAKKLNRHAVGYEISEEYCRLAVERCRQQVLELS